MMLAPVHRMLAASAIFSVSCVSSPTSAQTYTADPGTWRPVAYSDLSFPIGEAQSYASIWQDLIDESNKRQIPAAPGQPLDTDLVVGNRGASEWHFSINFQTKFVAVTVLNTPTNIRRLRLALKSKSVPCDWRPSKATPATSWTVRLAFLRSSQTRPSRIRQQPSLTPPTT